MVKKSSLIPALFLSFCTTDPVPEEDFEAPTGSFPLLGDVPARPSLPDAAVFDFQRQRLQRENDAALQEQARTNAHTS